MIKAPRDPIQNPQPEDRIQTRVDGRITIRQVMKRIPGQIVEYVSIGGDGRLQLRSTTLTKWKAWAQRNQAVILHD